MKANYTAIFHNCYFFIQKKQQKFVLQIMSEATQFFDAARIDRAAYFLSVDGCYDRGSQVCHDTQPETACGGLAENMNLDVHISEGFEVTALGS